jgi:DNA polymerase epsilon subunit 1
MESERVVVKQPDGEETNVLYADLKPDKQAAILKERVKDYSRRIHKRHKDTSEELREDVVCQRENGFYVETVRNIRVRRLSSSSNF